MSMDMSIDMEKMFENYKAGKIALYGLGTETERVLLKLGNKYDIVGLLDSFRTEGTLYGKQVISFDDALNAGIKLIIVVARPGSCRAIAKRVGDRCRKEGIALMDIRGRNLLEIKRVSYTFTNIDGMTRAKLDEKIKNADVISFDLFDTLVMRQTLSPVDVAGYVDYRLKEKGIFIEDFCNKRLESEKELSRNTAPALVDIYRGMLERMNGRDVGITAEKLAELEWEIDFGMLVPRDEMCDVFREAADSGRHVYVVSDTYYSKSQLTQVLEKCGITKYTDILSSSEYKMGKVQGLYKVLKDKEKLKRYLHIGDDSVADIEYARKCGFETYRVYSGPDLLEEVGNLGLSDFVNSLSDRLKTGIFVSRIFNSPFQFENGDRRITVKDAYDIGYLLCAPVISDFVCWFYEKIKENKIKNIWFGARDGYLIKKMYDYLLEAYGQTDKTVYFLTSRIAAIRAGIKDENDIRYVDEMKFSGTLEENLRERFGIDAVAVKSEDILADESGLMKYKKSILSNTCREYESYQKYIGMLDVREGVIAFFDFVAKGTAQMYIQRLTDNCLKGFYFLQLEKEHMKDKELDIMSFYESDEADTSAVFDDYYILEPVLTAVHPSVLGFNETGEPVYAVETRKEKDLLCIEKVQEGIMDYFKTYIDLCPKTAKTINKKLDEVYLTLIHKIQILDLKFLDLIIEDPFFNRWTKITDIL